jgi:hypothetical protein
MNDSIRTAICNAYVEFDVPADQIVKNDITARKFVRLVNSKLPAPARLNVTQCNSRLLSLRKKGEQNGGLPRIRDGHGPRPVAQRNEKPFGSE